MRDDMAHRPCTQPPAEPSIPPSWIADFVVIDTTVTGAAAWLVHVMADDQAGPCWTCDRGYSTR